MIGKLHFCSFLFCQISTTKTPNFAHPTVLNSTQCITKTLDKIPTAVNAFQETKRVIHTVNILEYFKMTSLEIFIFDHFCFAIFSMKIHSISPIQRFCAQYDAQLKRLIKYQLLSIRFRKSTKSYILSIFWHLIR